MKKITTLCLLLSIAIILFSCNKNKITIKDVEGVPNSLFFYLKNADGSLLTGTQDSNITLFCYDSLGHKQTKPFSYDNHVIYDTITNHFLQYCDGYYTSNFLIWQSYSVPNLGYEYGISEWYLQFPDGNVDTITAKIKHNSSDDVPKSMCDCYNQIMEIKYNGVIAPIDSSFGIGRPVYIFTKK